MTLVSVTRENEAQLKNFSSPQYSVCDSYEWSAMCQVRTGTLSLRLEITLLKRATSDDVSVSCIYLRIP